MTEKQEIDSRIEEIKWDDKSKFKEALDEKKILCFNNNISSNCFILSIEVRSIDVVLFIYSIP